MGERLHNFARRAQEGVDRSAAKALHKRENDSGSESDSGGKKKKKKSRKTEDKPQSWKYDEEYRGLIVPVPAFTEPSKGGADEDVYRDWKFEKRKRDFDEEREKQEEFAKSLKKQREDAIEFDDKQALLGEEKAEEPEEKEVIERDFADDAIRFDYESGKVVITRPLKPSWFADYNIFRPDDTVVLNGKRRTGKSFMMRKILYEMRHCFEAGVVFTATKHNGAYHASLAIAAH